MLTMLSRMAVGLLGVVLTSFCGADEWVGKRVFWKDSAVAKVGTEVVDKYKVLSWPAKVEDVNGEWLWLGNAWVMKTECMSLEQALEYFTGELRRDPTSTATWIRRAICWTEQGDFNRTIKDYDEAIRLDPNMAHVYGSRGVAKSNLKDYTGAIKDFNECIRLNPNYAAGFSGRGWVQNILKDYPAAMKDYDEALRLEPNSSYDKNNKSFLLSTAEDAQLRDPEKALMLADQVLRDDPDNAYTKSAKSCALAAIGNFEAAIRLQNSITDSAWLADEAIDGGRLAQERVARWKSGKLWHPNPADAAKK